MQLAQIDLFLKAPLHPPSLPITSTFHFTFHFFRLLRHWDVSLKLEHARRNIVEQRITVFSVSIRQHPVLLLQSAPTGLGVSINTSALVLSLGLSVIAWRHYGSASQTAALTSLLQTKWWWSALALPEGGLGGATSPAEPNDGNISKSCPAWFSHIKSDLQPWEERGGIRKPAVENARLNGASFRLQIINGSLYVQHFAPCYQTRAMFTIWGPCYQTRAMFTIWGVLQLLDRYGGQVPDVELMLECNDGPRISRDALRKAKQQPQEPQQQQEEDEEKDPPLMLKYCTTARHLHAVWPDWSFWGWPEVKIQEWETTRSKIMTAAARLPWAQRKPLAFWKGAMWVAPAVRKPVVECCDAPRHKWGVESYNTQWLEELDSPAARLENQCGHRYKVYVEGRAWSVSLKYIVACGSPTLFLRSVYDDFVTRALANGTHYLLVPSPAEAPVCPNLEKVVDWGNEHLQEAQAIGEAGASVMSNEVDMGHVYDYMLHFLQHYGSLQQYSIQREPAAEPVSKESLLKSASETGRSYLLEVGPQVSGSPCILDGEEVRGASLATDAGKAELKPSQLAGSAGHASPPL
eukprot:jgi/Mesen1/2034/ME000148S01125